MNKLDGKLADWRYNFNTHYWINRWAPAITISDIALHEVAALTGLDMSKPAKLQEEMNKILNQMASHMKDKK